MKIPVSNGSIKALSNLKTSKSQAGFSNKVPASLVSSIEALKEIKTLYSFWFNKSSNEITREY